MWFYDFLKEIEKEDGIEKFIVGAIIKNNKEEVLIAKRKDDDFMGGYYEIPGGNAEMGETILDTLIREVKEETNLNLIKVVSYINHFDYLSQSGKKCRQYNFLIEVADGDIILTEHSEYKWLNLNDLDKISPMSKEMKICLSIYKFNVQNEVGVA